MKNWLKKQVTEITAWIGFAGLISVFFISDSMTALLFIALIAIDDEKAKAIVARLAPWATKKIDGVD
jgi:Flp pilus assembly protein protease CpaA